MVLPWQIIHKTLPEKYLTQKRTGRVAQVYPTPYHIHILHFFLCMDGITLCNSGTSYLFS
jgi:hypothetical protein